MVEHVGVLARYVGAVSGGVLESVSDLVHGAVHGPCTCDTPPASSSDGGQHPDRYSLPASRSVRWVLISANTIDLMRPEVRSSASVRFPTPAIDAPATTCSSFCSSQEVRSCPVSGTPRIHGLSSKNCCHTASRVLPGAFATSESK